MQEEILRIYNYTNHESDFWVCVLHLVLKTFSVGVDIKLFYQSMPNANSEKLLEEIARHTVPIRPNRQDERNLKVKGFVALSTAWPHKKKGGGGSYRPAPFCYVF